MFAGTLQNSQVSLGYYKMFAASMSSMQDNKTVWRCRSCNKEVTNRWHHAQIHQPQRWPCHYCPGNYSRSDSLRKHIRDKHL